MGLGDFISGIFGSKNNATADAYQVDPNAYQYGGQAGGAAAASNAALAQQGVQGGRMGAADAMAGGLTGMSQDTYNVGQVGTGYATNALDQSQGARAAQNQVLGQMMAGANAPVDQTIAAKTAALQSQQLQAQQASAAASSRGPAALALAQQNAAGNTSTGQAAIAGQEGINAATEKYNLLQGAGSLAGGIRQGDLSTAGAGTSLAQTGYGASNNYAGNAIGAMNAGTGAAQVGLGYGQLANEINTTQLAAQQNEQGQKSSNQAGAQALNAQIQGQNASTNLSLGMGVVGGLSSLAGGAAGGMMGGGGGASAGAASAAGGAAAKGGAIGGKPYLVGEEGPELVVPRKPGYVMTAHQTAALLGGGPPTDQQQSYLSKAWHESRAMGGMMMPQQVRTQPNAPAWGFQGMPAAGQATAQTAPIQTGSLSGGGGGGGSPGPAMARLPMRADGGEVDPSPSFTPGTATWGTGAGTDPGALEGQRWAATQQLQNTLGIGADTQDERDRMAGQGMMTGLGMAGAYGAPGLNQAQGMGGVYAGLRQAGVATKPSPEAKKSDQAKDVQDKAQKPSWLQQGASDNARGWSNQAAHVDTSFHGGAGYVPPNLIPLRALGGPMGGANLGSNLGSGLGSSMGQGVNPYSGGQAQISQWANWNMKHPGALDNRADGGPMTSYEEELKKRCSGGLMAAYGKGGK